MILSRITEERFASEQNGSSVVLVDITGCVGDHDTVSLLLGDGRQTFDRIGYVGEGWNKILLTTRSSEGGINPSGYSVLGKEEALALAASLVRLCREMRS